MNRGLSICAIAASAVFTTSCSGGSGSGVPAPSNTPPPVVTQSYTFPSGDATGSGGVAWDIVGLKTTLSGSGNNVSGNSYDMLRVDVTFTQDISKALPAPGTALNDTGNQLGVTVAIDSDGNPSTGNVGGCLRTSLLKPFEYTTDQGNFPSRLADGNYAIVYKNQAIYSGASNPGAEAVVAVSGNTLSLSFNLNTLGVFAGTKVPRIGVGASAFNSSLNPATDCVPTASSGLDEVFTTPS